MTLTKILSPKRKRAAAGIAAWPRKRGCPMRLGLPPTSSREEKSGIELIFDVPLGQEAAFCAELPAGIRDVSDKDSYLFITQDVSFGGVRRNRGWRAFVVPKDNPQQWKEMPLTNLNVDFTNRRDFRAKTGRSRPDCR